MTLFQCPRCQKNFSRRSSLRNHIKIHDTSTGRYLQNANIERHLREIDEIEEERNYMVIINDLIEEQAVNLGRMNVEIHARRETIVDIDDAGVIDMGDARRESVVGMDDARRECGVETDDARRECGVETDDARRERDEERRENVAIDEASQREIHQEIF